MWNQSIVIVIDQEFKYQYLLYLNFFDYEESNIFLPIIYINSEASILT